MRFRKNDIIFVHNESTNLKIIGKVISLNTRDINEVTFHPIISNESKIFTPRVIVSISIRDKIVKIKKQKQLDMILADNFADFL